MFLTEVSPLVQECLQHPVGFASGFISGLLRLNLSDDPLKSWLDRQLGKPGESELGRGNPYNGREPQSGGPQSIAIE
jgi:hypothetical protein